MFERQDMGQPAVWRGVKMARTFSLLATALQYNFVNVYTLSKAELSVTFSKTAFRNKIYAGKSIEFCARPWSVCFSLFHFCKKEEEEKARHDGANERTIPPMLPSSLPPQVPSSSSSSFAIANRRRESGRRGVKVFATLFKMPHSLSPCGGL